MKRFVLIFGAIFVLILNSNGQTLPNLVEVVIGENDPCAYLWPDEEYDCHYSFELTIEGCDCKYIVEYCFREYGVNGGGEDYQITGIYGEGWDCVTCTSRIEVYQKAYQYLLRNDPNGIALDTQMIMIQQAACAEVREDDPYGGVNLVLILDPNNFINPSALSSFTYSVLPDGKYKIDIDFAYVPCGNVCCHMLYYIQKDPDTEKVIGIYHNMEGVVEWPECDNPKCSANCDVLEFDWEATTGKITVYDLNSSNIEGSSVKIIPNPNSGSFILEMNSDERGLLLFEIYNTKGETLFSKKFNKDSELFQSDIDIDEIYNGIFNFRIDINGKKIKTGKFIINN